MLEIAVAHTFCTTTTHNRSRKDNTERGARRGPSTPRCATTSVPSCFGGRDAGREGEVIVSKSEDGGIEKDSTGGSLRTTTSSGFLSLSAPASSAFLPHTFLSLPLPVPPQTSRFAHRIQSLPHSLSLHPRKAETHDVLVYFLPRCPRGCPRCAHRRQRARLRSLTRCWRQELHRMASVYRSVRFVRSGT